MVILYNNVVFGIIMKSYYEDLLSSYSSYNRFIIVLYYKSINFISIIIKCLKNDFRDNGFIK